MNVGKAITDGIKSTRDDDLFIFAHPTYGFLAWSPEQVGWVRSVLRWGRRVRAVMS